MKKKFPLKKVRVISLAMAAAGFLIILLGCACTSLIPVAIGLMVMLGASVFLLLFHRCPYCNAYLRDKGIFCPHCGNQIDC